MNSISYRARPVSAIAVHPRHSKPINTGHMENFRRSIKGRISIENLPTTAFAVGVVFPLPGASIIFPVIGFLIKYSYKAYKKFNGKSEKLFDKIV